MSSAYGIGRYGLGNYSAASTEDLSATLEVVTAQIPDPNRLRDGKETVQLSAQVEVLGSDNYRNGKATLEPLFNIDAIPTFVRNLVGSATLSMPISVVSRGNYETDGHSTIQMVPVLDMVAFGGKHWNPEAIEGNWTPDTVPESIWTPEVISGSPWG